MGHKLTYIKFLSIKLSISLTNTKKIKANGEFCKI